MLERMMRASMRAHYAERHLLGGHEHAADWNHCQATVCAEDRAAFFTETETPCSPGSAAPGAPSSPSSPLVELLQAATCPSCGAAIEIPVPRPAMLKASLPSVGAAGAELTYEVLMAINEALSELERLGGDAPHRQIPIVDRMKALFWMVGRECAERAYKGAWNQGSDGNPVPTRHFEQFTQSVLSGQVPAAWRPR